MWNIPEDNFFPVRVNSWDSPWKGHQQPAQIWEHTRRLLLSHFFFLSRLSSTINTTTKENGNRSSHHIIFPTCDTRKEIRSYWMRKSIFLVIPVSWYRSALLKALSWITSPITSEQHGLVARAHPVALTQNSTILLKRQYSVRQTCERTYFG